MIAGDSFTKSLSPCTPASVGNVLGPLPARVPLRQHRVAGPMVLSAATFTQSGSHVSPRRRGYGMAAATKIISSSWFMSTKACFSLYVHLGPRGLCFTFPHPGTRLPSQPSCGKLLVSEAEGDTEGSSMGSRWPGLDPRQPRPLIFLWLELVPLPTEHEGVGKGHLSRRWASQGSPASFITTIGRSRASLSLSEGTAESVVDINTQGRSWQKTRFPFMWEVSLLLSLSIKTKWVCLQFT